MTHLVFELNEAPAVETWTLCCIACWSFTSWLLLAVIKENNCDKSYVEIMNGVMSDANGWFDHIYIQISVLYNGFSWPWCAFSGGKLPNLNPSNAFIYGLPHGKQQNTKLAKVITRARLIGYINLPMLLADNGENKVQFAPIWKLFSLPEKMLGLVI